jgi:hypothetical protein
VGGHGRGDERGHEPEVKDQYCYQAVSSRHSVSTSRRRRPRWPAEGCCTTRPAWRRSAGQSRAHAGHRSRTYLSRLEPCSSSVAFEARM